MIDVLLLSLSLNAAPTDYERQLASELKKAREELLEKGQCPARVSHDCDKARFLIRRTSLGSGGLAFDTKGKRIGAFDSTCVDEHAKGKIPICRHKPRELETDLCEIARTELDLVGVTVVQNKKEQRFDKNGSEFRDGAFTGRVYFEANPFAPVHFVFTDIAAGHVITVSTCDGEQRTAEKGTEMVMPIDIKVNDRTWDQLRLRLHFAPRRGAKWMPK